MDNWTIPSGAGLCPLRVWWQAWASPSSLCQTSSKFHPKWSSNDVSFTGPTISPYLKPKVLQTSPSTMILMRGPLVFIECHSRSWSLHVMAKTLKISPLRTKDVISWKALVQYEKSIRTFESQSNGFLNDASTWKCSVLGLCQLKLTAWVNIINDHKWGYCGYKVKILHLPVLHVSGPLVWSLHPGPHI